MKQLIVYAETIRGMENTLETHIELGFLVIQDIRYELIRTHNGLREWVFWTVVESEEDWKKEE